MSESRGLDPGDDFLILEVGGNPRSASCHRDGFTNPGRTDAPDALISLTAFLMLAQGAPAQTPYRYSIPGSAVAVCDLAGAVTIERGTGANVVIEVMRGGRDAARLEVERTEVITRDQVAARLVSSTRVSDNSVSDQDGR